MSTGKTILMSALLCAAAACGDGDPSADPSDAPSGSTIDASIGPDAAPGPDAACYEDPRTYLQIINACTDADKIDRNPVLPLLNDDGSLPPLPE